MCSSVRYIQMWIKIISEWIPWFPPKVMLFCRYLHILMCMFMFNVHVIWLPHFWQWIRFSSKLILGIFFFLIMTFEWDENKLISKIIVISYALFVCFLKFLSNIELIECSISRIRLIYIALSNRNEIKISISIKIIQLNLGFGLWNGHCTRSIMRNLPFILAEF